jgi:hypothetical protein
MGPTWQGFARSLPSFLYGNCRARRSADRLARMSQLQSVINLTIVVPVEIGRGLVVPAGTYTGNKKTLRGQGSTEPQYTLELTAAQLNVLAAAQPSANLISVEYDVTKFVKLGQIVVSY